MLRSLVFCREGEVTDNSETIENNFEFEDNSWSNENKEDEELSQDSYDDEESKMDFDDEVSLPINDDAPADESLEFQSFWKGDGY